MTVTRRDLVAIGRACVVVAGLHLVPGVHLIGWLVAPPLAAWLAGRARRLTVPLGVLATGGFTVTAVLAAWVRERLAVSNVDGKWLAIVGAWTVIGSGALVFAHLADQREREKQRHV